MRMNFELVMQLINELREKMKDLNRLEFMAMMCMLYDEYYRLNKGGMTATEMAHEVADQVKAVNEQLGAYV